MRRTILVLVGIAISVTVFAGLAAAGASATNLCSVGPEAGNKCPAGSAYGVGQTFELKAVNTTFSEGPFVKEGAFGSLTCGESKLKVKLTGLVLNAPATGEVSELSFLNCTAAKAGACPTKALGTPWKTKVVQTGEVTGAGNGFAEFEPWAGELELEIECGGNACKYKNAKATTTLTGGNPASVKFVKERWTIVAGSPAACGAELRYSATFTTITPAKAWATV